MTDSLQTKREWLLREKHTYSKERRKAADEAHNARVELDRIEQELRELEKDEINALKGVSDA